MTSFAQLVADYQHLQDRLHSQPVIEQAKGVLMGRYRIDADTAFALCDACRHTATSSAAALPTARHTVADASTGGSQEWPALD